MLSSKYSTQIYIHHISFQLLSVLWCLKVFQWFCNCFQQLFWTILQEFIVRIVITFLCFLLIFPHFIFPCRNLRRDCVRYLDIERIFSLFFFSLKPSSVQKEAYIPSHSISWQIQIISRKKIREMWVQTGDFLMDLYNLFILKLLLIF